MQRVNNIYNASEMAQLYQHNPGVWLLLEVLERNAAGRAEKLRLLQSAADKDALYEFLLEQDDWNWSKEYVFVFSDPDKQCEIL